MSEHDPTIAIDFLARQLEVALFEENKPLLSNLHTAKGVF